MGISISHMGSMRHISSPTGASFSLNDGVPHEAQKRALPILVDYLQNKYAISDLHVQGHFQHKKPTCPGWDIEFWLLHREERIRDNRESFCWPIAPSSKDEPTFLRHNSGATQDARSSSPQVKRAAAARSLSVADCSGTMGSTSSPPRVRAPTSSPSVPAGSSVHGSTRT